MLGSWHNFLFASFDPGGLDHRRQAAPLAVGAGRERPAVRLLPPQPAAPRGRHRGARGGRAVRRPAPALRAARRARRRARARGLPLLRRGLPRQRRGPLPDPAADPRLRRRAARDPHGGLALVARRCRAGGARVQRQDPRRLPRRPRDRARLPAVRARAAAAPGCCGCSPPGSCSPRSPSRGSRWSKRPPPPSAPTWGAPRTTPSATSPSATTASAASKGRSGGPTRSSSTSARSRRFPPRAHTVLTPNAPPRRKHSPTRSCPTATTPTPSPSAAPSEPLRVFHSGLGGQGGWMLPFALLGLLALVLSVLWPPRGSRGPVEPPPARRRRPGARRRRTPQPTERRRTIRRRSRRSAAGRSAGRARGRHRGYGRGAHRRPPSAVERIRRDPRTAGLFVFGGWFLVGGRSSSTSPRASCTPTTSPPSAPGPPR